MKRIATTCTVLLALASTFRGITLAGPTDGPGPYSFATDVIPSSLWLTFSLATAPEVAGSLPVSIGIGSSEGEFTKNSNDGGTTFPGLDSVQFTGGALFFDDTEQTVDFCGFGIADITVLGITGAHLGGVAGRRCRLRRLGHLQPCRIHLSDRPGHDRHRQPDGRSRCAVFDPHRLRLQFVSACADGRHLDGYHRRPARLRFDRSPGLHGVGYAGRAQPSRTAGNERQAGQRRLRLQRARTEHLCIGAGRHFGGRRGDSQAAYSGVTTRRRSFECENHGVSRRLANEDSKRSPCFQSGNPTACKC